VVSMAEEQDRSGQRDWGGDTSALGGYGSAGLYSRRRQMERTTGGSYMNLSDAPRGAVSGGYVSMPTVGPRPQETTPLVSGHTGPSGPTAMAQGVRGSYAASPPDVPKWGQMAETLSRAGGAIAGAIGIGASVYKNRPRKAPDVPESLKALGPGPARFKGEIGPQPSLPAGPAPSGALGAGPDAPLQLGTGAIRMGSAPEDSQWRSGTKQGMGTNQYGYDDTATQRRDTGAIKQGPIQFAGELEEVAGVQREQPVTQAPNARRTPPGTGRAVNPRTTAGTEAEPRIAQMSSSYEYPNYNPRLGAKLGRTATRGERTATRDPYQMGLFDPND
jgi:hypothetical protein